MRWSYPQKDVRRSWGLFGIRIKESYEECGFWYVDPEIRSQDELKELHKVAVDGMSTEKHRAAIEKAIRAIPKDGGDLIDRLIEDREDATSTWKVKRKWSVVAVRTQKKNPYSSSKKAGKSEKDTDWYVVIKGETVDHVKRIRPHRQGDVRIIGSLFSNPPIWIARLHVSSSVLNSLKAFPKGAICTPFSS